MSLLKRELNFLLITAFAAILVFSSNVTAQKPKPKPKPTPQKQIRVEKLGTVTVSGGETPTGLTPAQQRRWDTFIKVWQTLEDNYFDRTFNGLDWYQIKSEYRPRVIAAKTDAALYIILQEMIQRLNRSHFAIMPPEVYAEIETAKRTAKQRERALAAGKGMLDTANDGDAETADNEPFVFSAARYGVGVDLRLIDGKFVVNYVETHSAAELTGIKPGFIIDKINGVSLSEMVARIVFSYPNVRNLNRYLPIEVVSWFLNGDKDSPVAVTCLDENDQIKEFKMTRQRLVGEAVSIGSNYPPQYLRFETSSLSDEVGYIKFNLFAFSVIEKFCDALTKLKDKKAIIVDLRGNLGGLLATLMGVSGMLTDHSINIGTSIYKTGSETLSINAKAKHFIGRMVFLVDNQTVSAAELFTAGMMENDRILVVGTTTAGEALPASSVNLPTGAVFIYPIANFKTKKGKFLEGSGLEPNYNVALDRASLLKGIDTQLVRAMALIKEDKAFPVMQEMMRLDRLATAAPPPPMAKPVPKPIQSGQGSGTGSGLSALPPPPAMIAAVKDEKSQQIIAEFLKIVGVDAFKAIKSYEVKGAGTLGFRGSNTPVSYLAIRQEPDKFAFIIRTGSSGEIREVHNGKKSFVESDYGYAQDLPPTMDASRTEIFAPIALLFDLSKFKSLTYTGVFDRDGRKSHIIDGRIGNTPLALVFDVQTKMFVSYAAYGPPVSYSDYRKVGDVMLPFHVEIERVFDIKLNNIRLNVPIDESNFQKKENCYDKPL